ncbi:MAG: hypothetical protein ACTSUV_00830 [Candidatus Ranarchaeia archaeon]
MTDSKNLDTENLIFGFDRTDAGDKAISKLMFGKNAEKMSEILPVLFELWGIKLKNVERK